MIELEIGSKAVDGLIGNLQSLKGDAVVKAIIDASDRAANTGRTAANKKIRELYTIKAGDINKRVLIKHEALGVTLKVKGPMEKVQTYRARSGKRGVYVTIKKGDSKLLPRSFMIGNKFMARTSKKRFPLKGLYGPSVAQLFGNKEVMKVIEAKSMEMYDKRLRHELQRTIDNL